MTKKNKFINDIRTSESQKLIIEVTVPNCPLPELIINRKDNFEGKANYYENAYNDDLELKTFNQIKIISYKFSD